MSASSGQHNKNINKGELGKSAYYARNLRLCEGVDFAIWRLGH